MSDLQDIIRNNILESMPCGLMVVAEWGSIQVANSTLCEILGYPRELILDKGFEVLFTENKDNDEFNDVLLNVIQKGHVNHRRQVWYTRPDKDRRYLEIISSFLRDEHNEWGLVTLVQDLTDLKLLHEREKNALEEKRVVELQRAESLRNLALSVAHQIRNPIMSIGGFINLAKKNFDNQDKALIYLGYVLESAERLQNMAAAVGMYASIGKPKFREILPESFIIPACEGIRSRAEHMGIYFEIRQDTLPEKPVLDEPGQMIKAVEAVLENALDACDDREKTGNTVSINVRRKGDRMITTISDEGQGIAHNVVPYVFDPFFTTRADRAGMGLTIARQILNVNRGDITISNSGRKGATVSIGLPCPPEQ
jgi:PAS domain S-box-containing protein